MTLDNYSNFVKAEIAVQIGSNDTTIAVGDASVFPDPANGEFNCLIWDPNTYATAMDDPDREIVVPDAPSRG